MHSQLTQRRMESASPGSYFSHTFVDMTRKINKAHYQHYEILALYLLSFVGDRDIPSTTDLTPP